LFTNKQTKVTNTHHQKQYFACCRGARCVLWRQSAQCTRVSIASRLAVLLNDNDINQLLMTTMTEKRTTFK